MDFEGIDKAVATVVGELRKLSKDVGFDNDKIKQVASVLQTMINLLED